MNFIKKCLLSIFCLGLIACGEKAEQTNSNILKVGAIAGPEAQLVETAKQIAKKKFNLDVEVVIFTDYVTPNIALNEKSIDLNAFQHKPYLDDQVTKRGFKIVSVANTFVYPIAGYSTQIKSIDELQDGDKIALPNDPTNLGRSLVLLEKQGLIKLKENVGIKATLMDIAENPKKLKFLELEAVQLPRTLQDVKLAIINNTFASQSGLTLKKNGLFIEDKESPYVNLIVARDDNQNNQKVKQFIQAYQNEEIYKKAQELFKGNVIKGW